MNDLPTNLPLLALPEADARPLLLAIQECLDDDLPRRALADWLEEHGDARSELIRAGLGGDLKRLRRWWEVYGEAWVGTLPDGARVEVPNGLITLVWPAARYRADPEEVPAALRAAIAEGWLFRLVLEGRWAGQPAGPRGAGDVLLDHVTVVRWPEVLPSQLALLRDRPRLRDLDLSQASALSTFTERGGWPALERLDLRGCRGLTTVTLEGLSIRSLRLGWCLSLSRVALADLPELATLTLGLCGDLRALTLRDVPKLREVSLRQCPWVTDTFLAVLAPAESIEVLDLSGCDRLQGTGLRYLAEMRRLKHLDLSECTHLSDVALAELPSLKALDLSHSGVERLELSELPDLGSIRLSRCTRLSSVLIRDTPRLPALPVANLRQLRRVEARGLPEVVTLDLSDLRSLREVALMALSSLRRLDLSGCGGLEQLTLDELPGLQKLSLRGCVNLPAPAFAQLGSLAGLRELDLGKCRRLEALSLSGLAQLERLALDECPGLRSLQLTALPALRALSLSVGALPAVAIPSVIEGLPALRSLEVRALSGALDWGRWPDELEVLRLAGTVEALRLTLPVKARELHLRTCYELRELELRGPCELRSLDLSGLGQLRSVRLDGLSHLRDLSLNNCRSMTTLQMPGTTALRRLRLEGCCSLDGAAALAVEEQVNLRELRLYGARRVSPAVVQHLKGRLPRCLIRA